MGCPFGKVEFFSLAHGCGRSERDEEGRETGSEALFEQLNFSPRWV